MNIITDIKEMQETAIKLKKQDKSIGFVPTMGYLHIGHKELILNARKTNDIVIVSIFVNPLQFGINEDLDKYPRNICADTQLCESINVDFLFIPDTSSLTQNLLMQIQPSRLDQYLCGASRPGHFTGVCTIVAKLFNITLPDTAYFGKKDIQQLKIIEQMVMDLNIPVRIIPVETVREHDGLAYSSRNSYLTQKERGIATIVPDVINLITQQIKSHLGREEILNNALTFIDNEKLALVNYIEIVDEKTLAPTDDFKQNIVIAVAIYIGNTKLIDNRLIKYT